MNIVTEFDLEKLNSLTRYPSILTYHNLDNMGILIEGLTEPKFSELKNDNLLFITEKIDGANCRIIMCGGDYLIGSRTEVWYAKDDRILHEDAGKAAIARHIIPYAERISKEINDEYVVVLYGEAYGGKAITKASRNYTIHQNVSFRLFDIAMLESKEIKNEFSLHTDRTPDRIKDELTQYMSEDTLENFSKEFDIPRVPLIGAVHPSSIPQTIDEVYEFLSNFKKSYVYIDKDDETKIHNCSEGIVIRSYDRKYIKKLRFKDYERAIRCREENLRKLKKENG